MAKQYLKESPFYYFYFIIFGFFFLSFSEKENHQVTKKFGPPKKKH